MDELLLIETKATVYTVARVDVGAIAGTPPVLRKKKPLQACLQGRGGEPDDSL
jgi:hypothetical protein